MTLQKIVCLGFTGEEFSEQLWREIDELATKRVMVSADNAPPNADCLLIKLGAKVGRDVIDQFPKLRYIGMLGTGYGGIDTAYAASRGITVTNIADYATEGVAEFTFAILLEHLRDVAKAKQQAAAGNYADDFSGTEIKGKTFGIIGLGHIGRRTAELAQTFGAKVIYWSAHRKADAESAGIEYSTNVLSQADVITANLALNSETENYFDATKIASIKPGTIVINPSPMELFDFPSLVERLKKNDITFLLDHSDEISAEQLAILQPLPNCIIYPPIAYLTKEASQLKKRIYIDNIRNFLSGQPTNKVD